MRHRVVCVLPAYNAERTVARTLAEVPAGVVERFILVDDGSHDRTGDVVRELARHHPIQLITHPSNRGYGACQKTCYKAALDEQPDVVVMLHPDHQYDPRLLPALASLVSSGVYDVALGSRILGGGALAGGMPRYKYVANRALTAIENVLLGQKLSEYHTGYRAWSADALRALDLDAASDDFVFDNQVLVQAHLAGFRIGEISVPTRYFDEASSIGPARAAVYGVGVLRCAVDGWAHRRGLWTAPYLRAVKRG